METNVVSSPVLGTSTILWGVFGTGIALSQHLITHLLNKKKVVVVPAETKIKDQVGSPSGAYLDEQLMALLAEEEAIENRFKITESTLHIPLVPEEVDLDEESPRGWTAFTAPDNSWNEEVEREQRTSGEPYVISAEEFIGNDSGYHQETVTYYEIDDIMADMRDVPVYGWPTLMGPLRWGHGSKDKNVVYIRNEKERKEWEVLLHHGSYEIEITGLQMEDDESELKHSLRKFRDD